MFLFNLLHSDLGILLPVSRPCPANALWTVYCIQYEGFSAEEDWSSLDRPAVEFWQPYVYNVLRYNNLYRDVTKEDISGRDVFKEKKKKLNRILFYRPYIFNSLCFTAYKNGGRKKWSCCPYQHCCLYCLKKLGHLPAVGKLGMVLQSKKVPLAWTVLQKDGHLLKSI